MAAASSTREWKQSGYFCRLLLVAVRWKCDFLANSNFLTWTFSEKAILKLCHHATSQDSTEEHKKGISKRTSAGFQHYKKSSPTVSSLQYKQNEHKLPSSTPLAGNRLFFFFFSKSTPTPSLCWLILFCLTWQDQVGQIWIICMLLTGSAADPLGCLSFTLTSYINEGCKSVFSKEIYKIKNNSKLFKKQGCP